MKCIVTAGPTYEELDEVRRLTNFSTGTVGTELASFLAARGHEVVLLRGHYSTCPAPPPALAEGTHIFTTTADLCQRLRSLGQGRADAVFHAAAVSDFAFGKIWRRSKDGALEEVRSAKIPTGEETTLAELVPTPKIIGELRGWFPNAFLAGWKYELEGDCAQALARGARQLEANRTDVCVVNGRAYGDGYGLVTGPGKCDHLLDKETLFIRLLALARIKVQSSAPGAGPNGREASQ
ncbi:MAG: phosphopantothenoylcysteine decarboxylase [Verrucomicrobiota bacterium]|jgi:phosphopantothenoylcysteine decarboxylase/phosphopantothenate--cysteine ligase